LLNEFIIARVVDAPREPVVKVWTAPRHARNWRGPRDYSATHLEMDVQPGGAFREIVEPGRQNPFQSVKERDGHQGGWTSTFDRLDQYLAKPRSEVIAKEVQK